MKFAKKQQILIDGERRTANKQHREAFQNKQLKELELSGVAISNLKLVSHTTAFRHVLKLERRDGKCLATCKLKRRDHVNLHVGSEFHQQVGRLNQDLSSIKGIKAVITAVQTQWIEISTDETAKIKRIIQKDSFPMGSLLIIQSYSEEPYHRLTESAQKVSSIDYTVDEHYKSSPLYLIFSEEDAFLYLYKDDIESCGRMVSRDSLFNRGLNKNQMECINFCRRQRHLAAIQGPPGKTCTPNVLWQLKSLCAREKALNSELLIFSNRNASFLN